MDFNMKKITVNIPQKMVITRTFTYEKIVSEEEAKKLQDEINSLEPIECSPEYLFGHNFEYIEENDKVWAIEDDEIETYVEESKL